MNEAFTWPSVQRDFREWHLGRRQFSVWAIRLETAGTAIAGQRIFYTGHSFHMFVPGMIDQIVKTTDIKGHTTAGAQGIGGSKVIQHWELADDINRSVIQDQVEMGVAVRMACMDLLARNLRAERGRQAVGVMV